MRSSWTTATLQQVTTKIGSGATPKGGKRSYKHEGISLVRSLNVHDREFRTKDLAFIDEQQAAMLDNVVLEQADVLLNITGASIARCCMMPDAHLPARVNQHVSIIRADQTAILPKFLCYLLTSKECKDRLLSTGEKQGATRQALTKTLIQNFQISFPSNLCEQKRIIAILDEAFVAIAKAKENAEKNLANARELFESYLNRVFTQQGDGWEEKTVGEIADHRLGKMLDKRKNKGELRPYLRNKNVRWFDFDLSDVIEMRFEEDEREKYTAAKGDVLVCEGGYPGRAAIWESDEPIYLQKAIHRIRFHNKAHGRWFVNFIFHSDARGTIQEYFTGAGIQHFTGKSLAKFRLPIPPTSNEVDALCDQFADLQAEAMRLEAVYTQKLANLDALKQSLLQKAFTGQLTTTETFSGALAPTILEFPTTIDGISTTDLHAGILALAYRQHELPKTSHFGRVKGEKIAHLIENHVGIELERSPVKDAAGPNDFGRILAVEARAKKAGFFAVAKKADRYELTPKPRFEDLINKTARCLADRLPDVMSIINQMAKMSTRQAEILATSFAAWNNLLIEGEDSPDEAIVYEARENWHPKKLKIEPEKFLKAIRWMRDKEITPTGRGKLVVAKQQQPS